jgi:hypothetical protein
MRDFYQDAIGVNHVIHKPNFLPHYLYGGLYDEEESLRRLEKHKSKPRILWAGSVSHIDHLGGGNKDDFGGIRDMILKTKDEYQWIFFGAIPNGFQSYVDDGTFESHPWCDIHSYPQKLYDMEANVLIAPLEDNVFNRSKSNIKLTEAGVMVHSYLMYGYPTQTVQETVDSLEMVRQLFELGVLQSGFWHQFALTAHSPVGLNPAEYGIIPDLKVISFANNDVQFRDKTGIDHDKFSFGLKKSLFNFMHGVCFDYELQEWFDFKIPCTTIPPDFIENCLAQDDEFMVKPDAKIVWLGKNPQVLESKKKNTLKLIIHDKTESVEVSFEKEKGEWLLEVLPRLAVANKQKVLTFTQLKTDYETHFEHFEMLWYAKGVNTLREYGLLVL